MSLGIDVTITKPCPVCGAVGTLELPDDGPQNINILGTLASRLNAKSESMGDLLTREIVLDGFPFLCPAGHMYKLSDGIERDVAAKPAKLAAREQWEPDMTDVCSHCGLQHMSNKEECG